MRQCNGKGTMKSASASVQYVGNITYRALLLFTVLCVAGLVRFYHLTDASIWSDEGFSLILATCSLSDIWLLSGFDVHPPLYHLILHGWIMLVGGDELVWTRGLSASLGVLNVALGIWLVRLVSNGRAAIVAGLLLALLPIAVRYSQDVRMYSLLGVELTSATLALVYWVRYPERARYLIVYVLAVVAAFYTHYFSIFCVGSHWLYLLLVRCRIFGEQRYVFRLDWWMANIAIVLLYMPWVPSLTKHIAKGTLGWIQPVTVYSLPSAFWRFITLNDGLTYSSLVYWLLPIIIVFLGGVVVRGDSSHHKFGLLMVLCLFSTLLGAIGISLWTPLFVERYLFFAALMLPMVIAIALVGIKNKLVFSVVLGVCVCLEIAGLRNNYNGFHTMNNPSRVADNRVAELMADFNSGVAAGDILVASDVYLFYAAEYYSGKSVTVLFYTPPLKEGRSGRPGFNDFHAPLMKFSDEIYLDNLQTLKSAQRVWWLAFDHAFESDAARIPADWRLLWSKAAGDNVLALYVICSGEQAQSQERCR
ncbi:hypothetical protein E4O96_17375 [Pseudomonas fluorescens]|nr:hypothetical protein [Pseudomonas fluorescens]